MISESAAARIRFGLIAGGVLALDQLTKQLIMADLALFDHVVVIPGLLDLVHARNTGAAFGLLAGEHHWARQLFFVAIKVIALILMGLYLEPLRKQGKWFVPALGLVAGGTAGNLTDRLRFGEVVDFIDLYAGRYHWPAFNVADAAICVGAGLFLLAYFRHSRSATD